MCAFFLFSYFQLLYENHFVFLIVYKLFIYVDNNDIETPLWTKKSYKLQFRKKNKKKQTISCFFFTKIKLFIYYRIIVCAQNKRKKCSWFCLKRNHVLSTKSNNAKLFISPYLLIIALLSFTGKKNYSWNSSCNYLTGRRINETHFLIYYRLVCA